MAGIVMLDLEWSIQRALTEVCETMGHQIYPSESMDDVVQIISTQDIDRVILDHERLGTECVRASIERLASFNVMIMLLTYDDDQARQVRAPHVMIITKPFGINVVLTDVKGKKI